MREYTSWKNRVGVYLDNSYLVNFLSPLEYVEFIADIKCINSSLVSRHLVEWREFYDVKEEKKYIRELSNGNKQKIGIIAANLGHPEMVILDKPFSHLDPASRNFLSKKFVEMRHDRSMIHFISDHSIEHILEFANRVLVMENGKIVKDLPNENTIEAKQVLARYFRSV